MEIYDIYVLFKTCFMRKKIDRSIFWVARLGLIITMIICLMTASAIILAVSFNISTRFPAGKDSWISITEYYRGIPFHARLGAEIPDSSIAQIKNGATSVFNYHAHIPTQLTLHDNVDYSDKIMADFEMLDNHAHPAGIKITGTRVEDIIFFVQPKKFLDRLLLVLPEIFKLLLYAFCSWQLLQIIRAIHSGNSFTRSSAQRIASIGWAVLIT